MTLERHTEELSANIPSPSVTTSTYALGFAHTYSGQTYLSIMSVPEHKNNVRTARMFMASPSSVAVPSVQQLAYQGHLVPASRGLLPLTSHNSGVSNLIAGAEILLSFLAQYRKGYDMYVM